MNYLCVDFGGTKTLVCIVDDNGTIKSEIRFETPKDYPDFIDQLASEINNLAENFRHGVMSVPGLIDQTKGEVIALGNRPWTNFALRDDLKHKTGVEMKLLNDARLAGLAEASYLKDEYERVLYITISTGIGGALTVGGKLVEELNDMEFGKMPIMVNGEFIPWEDVASGRAIVAKYGKLASDITSSDIWKDIANDFLLGVGPTCATFQPDAIVFGGGVGQQTDKFSAFITEGLQAILHPVIRQPRAIIKSHHQNEAVIYGCYELAKQNAGSN